GSNGATTETWRSWDQILMQTLMKDSGAKRDQSQASFQIRYDLFACPSDIFPRRPDPNYSFQIRSYGVNQSKWTYGLDDGNKAPAAGELYKAPYSGGRTVSYTDLTPKIGGTFHTDSTQGQLGLGICQDRIIEVYNWNC